MDAARDKEVFMCKRIFIMGQCTLHWGRMEFGNIGNYYIVDPMFEGLRRVFPEAQIVTTMQFSRAFCAKYGIMTVPQELYYSFEQTDNLEKAKYEYKIAIEGLADETPYIREIRKSDLIIDFSGDLWGDNADFIGKDRFETGLYKDMVAQKLKPTAMIAGSPGPFSCRKTLDLARKVYADFDLVINRETASSELLRQCNFDLTKTQVYPCPSFLFQGVEDAEIEQKVICDRLFEKNAKLKIGLILCGWNFQQGPFDLWPRQDREYKNFAEMVCRLSEKYNADFFLLSHANGFDVPPAPFRIKHGRDFPIMKQLHDILLQTKNADNFFLLDGIYLPEVTKGMIGKFDILISGRMHGAVAGLSQAIPTMIIDYGHEPKAHKLIGFAEMADIKAYIANPNDGQELLCIAESLIENRDKIHNHLNERMKFLKSNAQKQFELLSDLIK